MSDVIRDVLIRIAVQQVQGPTSASTASGSPAAAAPNAAPVIEATKKAEQVQIESARRVERAQVESSSRMRQAMDQDSAEWLKGVDKRLQDLLNRQAQTTLRQVNAREKLAIFNRQKAEEEAQAEAQATLRKIRSQELYAAFVRKKNEETARDAALQSEKMAQAAVTATARAQQATIQATQALRGMGESITLVIRGIAILSSGGDKDLERLLHRLIMIQGAIDLYKGAVGTITSLANAYRSVAAAASAAAVAQSASAAASGASAGAGIAGAGGAGAAGALGFSRLGLGAAALAVGALAGFGLNRAGGGALLERLGIGVDSNRLAREQAEGFLRTSEARDSADNLRRNATRNFLNRQGAAGARLDARFNAAGIGRAFEQSEADVSIAESQRAAGRARTLSERRAAEGGQSGALALRGAILRRQDAGLSFEVAAFEQQRRAAQARAAEIGDEGGTNAGRLEARKAALEAQQEAERNIVAALGRQREHRQKLVDQQRQAVELAKDQLQTEKDRVAGLQQSLGSLNEGQVSEIKRINKKVAGGGQVTEEELRFLEQNGGGSFGEFTGEQRRKRGEAAFGKNLADVAALTGGGSQVEQKQKELDAIIRNGQQGESTVKLLEKLAETRKKEAEALERLANSSAAIGDLAAKIDRIRDDIELLTKRQDRRAQAQRNL